MVSILISSGKDVVTVSKRLGHAKVSTTTDIYCDYVINLKEQWGAKHSTIVRYKELASRIYPDIGHIKPKGLRVDHLNTLYTELSQKGIRKGSTHSGIGSHGYE